MLLSVIIPCYNEPTLLQLIENLYKVQFQKEILLEVIVVNDGSTDHTFDELEKKLHQYPNLIIINHEENRGKGAAIKTALMKTKGNMIIIQDADLEYDPSEIPKVIQPIIDGKTLVCYGSRHLGNEQKKQNILWLKKHFRHTFLAALGGRMITWMFNWFFGAGITDAPTCYKAFSAEILNNIDLKNDGFEMEAELTAKTLKKTKILEVPIHYLPRTKKEGKKIRWHDGFKSLAAIIKYRFMN